MYDSSRELTRRSLLRAVGAFTAGVALRSLFAPRAAIAGAASHSRPRFYLQIIPEGGMDAIYTVDPKAARDVETGIDVPYKPSEIVTSGALPLAPTFGKLASWTPRLAIVNAFLQNSANHPSGLVHSTRFKSSSSLSAPTLMELLGARRDAEIAVGAINIGTTFAGVCSPQYFGEPGNYNFGPQPGLFEHLDAAAPDDLVAAARALDEQAGALAKARDAATRITAENLRAGARFLHQAATAPKFALASSWTNDVDTNVGDIGGSRMQRALWLLENRLARCVTVLVSDQGFDTHVRNQPIQGMLCPYLAFLLDRLFGELDRRSVGGRPLSEQTAVVIGSEIGRFPRLNAAGGKDHFPQASYMFFGPWFANGKVFGATGRQMEALPMSPRTGRPDPSGQILRVDDIGTTLLRLDEADPDVFGYTGTALPFLVA